MKLATLNNATRDGQLVVVSTDLNRFLVADEIAPTLQYALDNWSSVKGALRQLSDSMPADAPTFKQCDALSPLPRAYQWADGSAYVNHVELVRKARGVEMPESFWTEPLMYQGGSDTFLSPHQDICMPSTEWGIDMEGEIAVIVDDVPMGVTSQDAAAHIKLLMLVNDVSLRGLIPGELAKGFGFFQSKPSSAFSPTAITPEELGDAWRDGKVHLPLLVNYNGSALGCANAGVDMTFNFPELIQHAAKSRGLCAGTIIGSGTVSNKLDGGAGKPINKGGVGYSCIAEMRTIETIEHGKPSTPFMQFGDSVSIDMRDVHGQSLFGEIKQSVRQVA